VNTQSNSKRIKIKTIFEQIRNNAVALISLTVAICGLGYNTWRNETTEAHRNDRYAGFELIEKLADLQSVVNELAYGEGCTSGRWIQGWGEVITIRSLGALLPGEVANTSQALEQIWETEFRALCEIDSARQDADKKISSHISATNKAVMDVLVNLD